MGSSVSLQVRDKRRRSNRLSKPPQDQAVPDPASFCSWRQLPEQTLSLPATPITWQNPWESISVPAGSHGITANDEQPQSPSLKPCQRPTTCQSKNFPMGKRPVHGTASTWPQLRTPLTAAPSRQGSVYERASFHPSETATFQPTTLQSCSQSPLMGQPKRSYSVHLRSQKAKGNQRRALGRFASISSHSRAKSQGSLPIRRGTLLLRPGMATREATKSTPPTFFSENYQDDAFSNQLENEPFDQTLPRFLPHENEPIDDLKQPLSRYSSSTVNDFGYTHLGSLSLGSLRVVNGTASPSPSDRTRLSHADAPVPDSISANQQAGELLDRAKRHDYRESRPASSDGLGFDTECHSRLESQDILENVTDSLHRASEPSHHDVSGCSPASPRSEAPATMPKLPPYKTAQVDIEVPASPLSFMKSPTSTSGRVIERHGAEDEGISVRGYEKVLKHFPEKVPDRHFSYSSYESSHRREDSGYSSAASHRNSIDSHASLQRSPGFRKVLSTEKSKDNEFRSMNPLSRAETQHVVNRQLSLQDRKLSHRLGFDEQPKITGENRDQLLIPAAARPRCSSLPASGSSGALPFPLPSAAMPIGSADFVEPDKSICYGGGLESSEPYTAFSSMSGHPDLYKKHRFSIELSQVMPDNVSQELPPVVTTRTRRFRHHSSDVKYDFQSPMSRNCSLPFPEAEKLGNKAASEQPRGRARSRSIEYQHLDSPGGALKPR